MKKTNRYLWLISLMLLCNLAYSQNKRVSSIQIKYINFIDLTDTKINCNEYEYMVDFKTLRIKDQKTINLFMAHFQNIKKDIINHYFLDTRAKIIIVYKSNASDTICISGFGCCINNSSVYRDDKFISFIEKLIKKRDSTFKYKNDKLR